MNKELEEAAVRKYPLDIWAEEESLIRKLAFSNGAKWMEEQMFSKEDMREAIIFGLDGMYGYQWGKEGETDNQINKYLEELKKK